MDAPDDKAWASALPWTDAPDQGPPRVESKFGDVQEVAANESKESMLWRLTELEARSLWLEQLDQKFDAFAAEVSNSNVSLWKQVAMLERALGFQASVPREVAAFASASRTSRKSFGSSRTTSDEPASPEKSSSSNRPATASSTASLLSSPPPPPAARPTGPAPAPQPYGLRSRVSGTSEAVAKAVHEGLKEPPAAAHIGGPENGDAPLELIATQEKEVSVFGVDCGPEATNLEARIERMLAPSVWNAAFLIGMNRTGWAASITILILLLINIVMQCTFLGIINKIVATELFDANEIEILKNWRYFVGQSVNYYDPLTKTALAQRICAAGDATSQLPVELSDSKAQLIEAVKAYLPASEGVWDTIFSGPSLSMIALVFWTLKVFAEFQDTLDTTIGMMWVPRGRRNLVVESEEGTFRFASFTRMQKIHIGIVLLVRAVVCGLLWGLGCHFLLNYSIEPAELILNAVALEIVLNVDEVLFTLVPLGAKHLLSHLEPLPGPRSPTLRHFNGLDLRSAFLTILLVVCSYYFYFESVGPLMDRIAMANKTLCSGVTNTIFATDPYQFVYTATLEENTGGIATVSAPTEQAVREIIYPETVPLEAWNGVLGRFTLGFPQALGDPPSYLRQVSMMTNTEAAVALQEDIMGRACENIMQRQVVPFMYQYMAPYGIEAETCADLYEHCTEVPVVRVVCPQMCGCDSPVGRVFDLQGNTGCPLRCLEAGRWQSMVATMPCKDWTLQELEASDFWHSWVVQFEERLTYIITAIGLADGLAILCAEADGNCTKMFAQGCDFVRLWPVGVTKLMGADYSPNACNGQYFGSGLSTVWRPLAPICPESCGCVEDPGQTAYTDEDSPVPACPSTCNAGSTSGSVGSNSTTGSVGSDSNESATNETANDTGDD